MSTTIYLADGQEHALRFDAPALKAMHLLYLASNPRAGTPALQFFDLQQAVLNPDPALCSRFYQVGLAHERAVTRHDASVEYLPAALEEIEALLAGVPLMALLAAVSNAAYEATVNPFALQARAVADAPPPDDAPASPDATP